MSRNLNNTIDFKECCLDTLQAAGFFSLRLVCTSSYVNTNAPERAAGRNDEKG